MFGDEHLLRAAGEQRHPRPGLPDRRVKGGQRLSRRQRPGEKLKHRPERGRKGVRQRARTPTQKRRKPKAPRVGQRLERHRPLQPVDRFALAVFLCVGAERCDQIAVFDPGRARGFTRLAAEAVVDVRQRVVELDLALEHLLHQEDAAAWRVHLLAELDVGGAGRQAEAAVHARLDRVGHAGRLRPVLLDLDFVAHRSDLQEAGARIERLDHARPE